MGDEEKRRGVSEKPAIIFLLLSFPLLAHSLTHTLTHSPTHSLCSLMSLAPLAGFQALIKRGELIRVNESHSLLIANSHALSFSLIRSNRL